MADVRITDFTFDFQRASGELNRILFNPSISWFYDDFYIVCCRAIRRDSRFRNLTRNGDILRELPVEQVDVPPTLMFQHPWFGGYGSATWWRDYQEDSTLLFLTRMRNDRTFVTLQYMGNMGPEYCQISENCPKGYRISQIIDGRLFRRGEINDRQGRRVQFYVTGNQFIPNPKKDNMLYPVIKWGIMEIRTDDFSVRLLMSDYQFLCENKVAEDPEKNWNFFVYHTRTGVEWNVISHNIAPNYDMLGFKQSDLETGGPQRCEWLQVQNKHMAKIFQNIQQHYYFVPEQRPYIHMSLSTPSYPVQSSNGTVYISVGHVKVEWKKVKEHAGTQGEFIDPLYEEINRRLKDTYLHPIYVYYGFMYTFVVVETKLGLRVKVRHLSPLFMVEGFGKNPLCFPSGLAYNPEVDLVSVSYGESDLKAKAFTITKDKFLSYCTISAQEMENLSVWPTMVVGRDEFAEERKYEGVGTMLVV